MSSKIITFLVRLRIMHDKGKKFGTQLDLQDKFAMILVDANVSKLRSDMLN